MNGGAPIAVFGGTGFLGRAVVARLLADAARVRVAARTPATAPRAGVEPVVADVRDEDSVARAVEGARAVVDAVGLYLERGAETFEAVHVAGAGRVARRARTAGAESFVLVSGIGADPASPSGYVRSRAAGEGAVREAFPDATILRPSVLFGPGDGFVNLFDRATAILPVFPLFGHGGTRVQPVHVDDVAGAVARAIDDPAVRGHTLELGGASVLTLREVVERVLAYRRRRRVLLPVPLAAWSALAAGLAWLPSPPVTRDQLALVRADNVVDPDRDGFAALGLGPRDLDTGLAQSLPPRT